jgi:hypothetical protein
MRRGVAFALLLTVGIATVTARGDEPTRPLVALLRPDPPDPALGQMFVRIEGELRAAGFDVTIVARGPDEAPQAAIERASETHAPAAIIGVFGGSLTGMELWVADRLTGRSVVRHLNASGESGTRASEILAIRAAEQLSASLIELDLAPKPAQVAPAPGVARDANAAKSGPALGGERPAERSRFRAELGIGTLFTFEGAGPTVTPVGRLSWSALPAWEVRMTGAWLGSRSSITSPSGSASFSQDLLLVEGVFSPSKPGVLGLRASLGVGTLHAGVEGRGSGSVQGLDSSIWVAAVDAGVGVGYRRATGMGFAFEGHAVFANPYPVVRLLDETQATIGRPTLFATAALTGDL